MLYFDDIAQHLHNGRAHHAATTVLGLLAKLFGATVTRPQSVTRPYMEWVCLWVGLQDLQAVDNACHYSTGV